MLTLKNILFRTVQNLFLKVQTRGPEAFNGLVRALFDSGNQTAARILDPSVQLSSYLFLYNGVECDTRGVYFLVNHFSPFRKSFFPSEVMFIFLRFY